MQSSQSFFKDNILLLGIFLLGSIIWLSCPAPREVQPEVWHLLIIFLCTITGIIFSPLPIGALTSIAAVTCVLTNTLTLPQVLSGFAEETSWLVLLAFFISNGFVKSGLGNRIAYFLISRSGGKSLNLAYSLVTADLIMSSVIPSVTARGGGIMYPIAKSLSQTHITHDAADRDCAFLMQICFQSNVITSAIFLTAMAANPIGVGLASQFGIEISWIEWFKAACVPGLLCLILMPLAVYYLSPPATKHSDLAPKFAAQKLSDMGTMRINEWTMLLIFSLLIFLWVFGKDLFGINATTTTLIGYCLMIIFKVISFEESIDNKASWHTYIWYSHLIMMSIFLAKLGMMAWIGAQLKLLCAGLSPLTLIVSLSLIYFYMHYIFASATAHMMVLFPTFCLLLIDTGLEGKGAALLLIFLSIISSGLTHFGLNSAPIFYSASKMKIQAWFRTGFCLSLLYLAIWCTIGISWWQYLGFWVMN